MTTSSPLADSLEILPIDDADEEVRRRQRQNEEERREGQRHNIVYATLAAFAVIFFGAVGIYSSGLLQTAPKDIGIPWELTIIFMSFLLTAILGLIIALQFSRRKYADDPASSQAREELRGFAVMASGVAGGVVLTILAFFAWLGVIPGLESLPKAWKIPGEIAAFGLVAATMPYGITIFRQQRRTRLMEERFPDFLRDVTEGRAAGMTMAQALRSAARGDYGALSPDVKHLSQQVSWGVSFQESFGLFGRRVGTPLVERTVNLINKATLAGGETADVLAAAARDARELKNLESERRTNMGMYVIVMYLAYIVFLSVTLILAGVFIPAMLNSTSPIQGGSIAGVRVEQIPASTFSFIYFGAALVQAIGSGIVAGVMAEGSFASGVKHASFMTAFAAVAFLFV